MHVSFLETTGKNIKSKILSIRIMVSSNEFYLLNLTVVNNIWMNLNPISLVLIAILIQGFDVFNFFLCRRISGVWGLGTAAPPVSVTDWGLSIPSVTRGLAIVHVDLGSMVNSVTNVNRDIMASPSVAVNVSHHAEFTGKKIIKIFSLYCKWKIISMEILIRRKIPTGCQPCDKPGHVCDSITGQCVCPPLTTGPQCGQCQPNTWGHDRVAGCKVRIPVTHSENEFLDN